MGMDGKPAWVTPARESHARPDGCGDHHLRFCGNDDDDCFYYHSWRNNVVIAFGTLSSLDKSNDLDHFAK